MNFELRFGDKKGDCKICSSTADCITKKKINSRVEAWSALKEEFRNDFDENPFSYINFYFWWHFTVLEFLCPFFRAVAILHHHALFAKITKTTSAKNNSYKKNIHKQNATFYSDKTMAY